MNFYIQTQKLHCARCKKLLPDTWGFFAKPVVFVFCGQCTELIASFEAEDEWYHGDKKVNL